MATIVDTANSQFSSLAQRSILNVEKDVEKRIMSDVFQKQIRVRDFFFDFDKLRKGVVNEDKFRTALSMFNIYLSKDDIEELIRRYKDKDGNVRYSDFCQNVDAQFFDHDYARDNLNQTKSSANYDNYEQKVVSNALKQFKYIIKTKRILLKQPFQDFDRTKTLHVTKEQFARVLTSLGFLLDQQKFDILARNYMDKGNTREVNYVKFCQDVDDLSDLNKGADSHKEKKNDSSYVPEDVVKDTSKLNLMGSLYVSKRLATDTQTVDIEKKIQGECVMKQIRIRQFFKDFDGLKKGTVTETQFRRILHMSGIEVNEEEFAVLVGRYKTPENLINYAHFVEVIDSVFTTKGLEKDPLYKVPQLDSSTAIEGRRKYLALSEEEKELLQYVMDEYRRQIKDRRMLIKPNFQDFDRTKNGHVSKNQFLRILNQFGLFPDERILNLLLKRYIDKGNLDEVNYYDFVRDIEVLEEGRRLAQEYAESFKNPDNRQQFFLKTFILNDNPNDLEDLLARMRKKVKQNRIRIGEFLRDFDKLRSGTITATKFRMALNNATLPVSDQEFNLIVQNFKSHEKEGFIRWKDFVGAIEEVFTTKNLEKNPSTIVSEPTLQYNYGKNPMTSQEVALAEKVKRRFIEFARATRLDIKQFFKDWDRLGRNKVSPKQFRQVLATINFILNEDEFAAVVRYYQSEDDNDVRYIEFINDTNPNRYLGATLTTKTFANPYPAPESELLKDAKKSQATTVMLESSSPNKTHYTYRPEDLKESKVDVHLLLEKIRNDVKVRQLRVGDYLKDYDGLRKGLINSNKFRGVLSQMKIELTEEELEALEKYYIWPDNNEYPYKINYSQFINDIDIVFTITGLEKDPLIKPETWKAPAYLDPKDILTPQEEQRLHEFMYDLGQVVFKHRILVKPYFQDKDKTKCGKLSFPRFRAVLDVLKLPIPDSDYHLLCKRFGHEGKEFNYVEFCEVLKRYSEFDR